MTLTFEIICLGNELLIGKILNTNAQWLAKNITRLGGRVHRIIIGGDELEEISSIIRESLARKPNFVITTGGLGPTFDDMTVEAVATALNRPMELNEKAFLMIKDKYHQYEAVTQNKIELTPARLKMAEMPNNAIPLPNPIGTAPGVLSEEASSKIVNLPGVPAEMKAIFEGSVIPLIQSSGGQLMVYEKSLNVNGIIESELAPLLDDVRLEHPKVYIKSHPMAAEPNPIIELHFFTSSVTRENAKLLVEAAEHQISHLIKEHGGVIRL